MTAIELLSNIWSQFSSELVSGIIALFIGFLAYILRPRVSIIWGQANHSWHSIPVEEKNVHIISEKNFIQNMGRAPATDVEVVYQSAPNKLLVFPQRDYHTKKNPDGAHIVTIPFIAPRELITLDGVFIGAALGHILSVKSKEAKGKKVNFWVVRKLPNWVYYCLWFLIFLGLASIIGMIIKLLGN